jgi:fibronectin type 3 domain-containing protein
MILTPGQSAPLTVTFAPTSAGAVSGASVTIASNATNSPAVISLSGAGTHSVMLSWGASTTAGAGYNIYRGTASGAEGATPLNLSALSATSFSDVNVTSGQSYYYVVQAVNANGTSGNSNEVQVSVPTP